MIRIRWIEGIALLLLVAAPAVPAEELEPVAVTMWGPAAELFVEFPPLRTGEPSRFAIHLTDIRDPDRFLPVSRGKVTVRLEVPGSEPVVAATTAPRIPGIFGVTVVPSAAGPGRLRIELQSEGAADAFELEARVHGPGERIEAPEEPSVAGTEVPFLKEQQWQIPFGTAVAAIRPVRDSFPVLGEVRPRGDGEAKSTPPRSGVLGVPAGGRWPVMGTEVEAGAVLALVIPAASMELDRAQAESEARQARVELDFARSQQERAERLTGQGAIPRRDLEEARKAVALAESRVTAAGKRLKYLLARQEGEASEGRPEEEVYQVRAPIAGTVVEVTAVPGERVGPDDPLFTIIDLASVWIVGRVFEPDIVAAREARHATFRFLGSRDAVTLEQLDGRLVTVGSLIDGKTRTVPVVFEVANQDRRLRIGQFVEIDIETGDIGDAVTIPETAIHDDGGRDVVFVQAGGESFRKRRVQTGVRQRGYVQILSGLAAGERVVTSGGYEVYLQSVSKTIPEHGHAH